MEKKETASARELARLFTARSGESRGGERLITPGQINAWYAARDRNGFPAEEPERRANHRTRPVRVWDLEAAWSWFRDYEPSKGGAPKGNQNAVRHGRCIGVRAERESRRTPLTPAA